MKALCAAICSTLNSEHSLCENPFPLRKYTSLLGCLLLSCISAMTITAPAAAQDRLEPFKVGEAVEVLFLNDWRPGVILATDKQQNARVEFEFAGSKQVDEFLRAAVRRPYEKGAIIATRTYSDASGNFKIVAAAVAVTDTQIRLRKSDNTELDVPVAKLSDADQRFLKSLIKQGLPVSPKLPGPRMPGARIWTLRDGRSVDGLFVKFDRGKLSIKLADNSVVDVPVSQLSPSDVEFAMEREAENMKSQVDSDLRKARESMRGDNNGGGGLDIAGNAGNNSGIAANSGPPPANLRSKLLEEDRWGFTPDNFQRAKTMPLIETSLLAAGASKVVTHDGTKVLLLSPARQSILLDLRTGQATDLGDVARAIEARGFLEIKSISPAGSSIVYQDRSSLDTLSVHDLKSGKDLWSNWAPYGSGRDVYHVRFIDDEHLLTVSTRGDLGVWKVATREMVWWTVTRPVCVPALSAGAKYLVLHTNEHLVVVEALTGKVVSQVRSNPVAVRFLAVDDTCQRLVGLGNGNARFWDLRTGKVVREFGVAPVVFEPSLAFWVSPTRVFVNGLRSQSDLFDVIDLSLQGSAYCVKLRGHLLAAPNSGQIFAASLPKRSLIMQPDLPSAEMQKADEGFAGNLFANLGQGSRVQIELSGPASMNRNLELERITALLTNAGYKVVSSGGEATFVASIKANADYSGVELDDLPDEAFEPKQNLVLKKNGAIVWRATKDVFGIDKENRWSGLVIPTTLRIPNQLDVCFVLRKPQQWVLGELKRDYDQGLRQSHRYKTTYQPTE